MKNGQTLDVKKRAWKKPQVKAVTPVRETRAGILVSTKETVPAYMTS